MQIDTSSVDNPLAFFENILSRNGIAVLRNEFIPSPEEEAYFNGYLTFNVETEIKEHLTFDPNSGNVVVSESNFRDFFYNRCNEEYIKTIGLIDEKILTISNTDSIGVFINVIFERLKYLRNSIIANNELVKYSELKNFPNCLEKLLSEKYKAYIEKHSNNVLSDSPKIILPQDQYQIASIKINSEWEPNLDVNKKVTGVPNPGVFKWTKGDSKNLSNLLFKFLSEKKMIDTTPIVFSKAFSGINCENPLKIKWTDPPKNKSDINKATLLYLFQKLCENELIETIFDSKELTKKLAHVFVDRKGNEIRHWIISKSSVGKTKTTTPSKRLIDEFISSLNTL
jgi:hypothetical protein